MEGSRKLENLRSSTTFYLQKKLHAFISELSQEIFTIRFPFEIYLPRLELRITTLNPKLSHHRHGPRIERAPQMERRKLRSFKTVNSKHQR